MCLLFDWDTGQLEAIFEAGDLEDEEPPTRQRQFGGPVDLRPGERLEVLPVCLDTDSPRLLPFLGHGLCAFLQIVLRFKWSTVEQYWRWPTLILCRYCY